MCFQMNQKACVALSNLMVIHGLQMFSDAIFTARRSYASAVLGVVILSVRPSGRPSHACFVTNPKNLPAIFLYHMKGQSF